MLCCCRQVRPNTPHGEGKPENLGPTQDKHTPGTRKNRNHASRQHSTAAAAWLSSKKVSDTQHSDIFGGKVHTYSSSSRAGTQQTRAPTGGMISEGVLATEV